MYHWCTAVCIVAGFLRFLCLFLQSKMTNNSKKLPKDCLKSRLEHSVLKYFNMTFVFCHFAFVGGLELKMPFFLIRTSNTHSELWKTYYNCVFYDSSQALWIRSLKVSAEIYLQTFLIVTAGKALLGQPGFMMAHFFE